MLNKLPNLTRRSTSNKYIYKWQDVIAALPPPELEAARITVRAVRAIVIK